MLCVLAMPILVSAGEGDRDAKKEGKKRRDHDGKRKCDHIHDQIKKWEEEGLSEAEIETKTKKIRERHKKDMKLMKRNVVTT